MRFLSRVVWSEGMHLGPHHFQAQNRYFEDSIDFAASTLWFEPYGWTGYGLEPEALANGTLALAHGRGILPDGTPFWMPDSDPLPEPRPIADLFPPTQDRLTVRLTIPPRKPEGVNCTLNGEAPLARYVSEVRPFHDENTGGDERAVRTGRKNLRLMFDTEDPGDLVSLPLARVMRGGSGHFVFDPEFIPPCLRISASERLMLLARRLIEILEEKSASLSRGADKSGAEFSTREIANFWLLHAVNSGLAALRHLWISKRGHPEELFLELSRLAGALCTFRLDSHPRSLPVYDHQRLSECFDALDRHIRAHLETVIPTNCVTIPLKKTAEWIYEGDVADQRVLGPSRWVLAIRAGVGEAELITKVPQLVKVCSAQFVGELVKRALPGLGLTHVPVPPPAISTRADTQYFAIERSGPFWYHLAKTRRAGVYVPADLPNADVEIQVVLDT